MSESALFCFCSHSSTATLQSSSTAIGRQGKVTWCTSCWRNWRWDTQFSLHFFFDGVCVCEDAQVAVGAPLLFILPRLTLSPVLHCRQTTKSVLRDDESLIRLVSVAAQRHFLIRSLLPARANFKQMLALVTFIRPLTDWKLSPRRRKSWFVLEERKSSWQHDPFKEISMVAA